ncbi:MAG: transcription-repair coupling factor [Muribaculaceae bacterium]|nr:transcription-repair coupling factor [Muribaculaceae bacterium]MDE6753949.1 transcription-repair coupling factor [Muribaculaceae bacterium]
MQLKEADELFATAARRSALSGMLEDKKIRRVRLSGLKGSAAALLFASLPEKKSPWLIVADDMDAAGYIYHDLCQTAGAEKVAIFPSGFRRDIKYGQPDPPSQILRTETLDAWTRKKHPLWVVTCPEALAEKVPSREDLSDSTLSLRTGGKADMGEVRKSLRTLGFKEVDYVYEPGQFAVRGSIMDVYSYSGELPYRIDWFDDEIDSIRMFNVETQLSERKLDSVSVIPSSTTDGSSAGVSLPEFADASTVVFCQSVEWVKSRVRAVCEEKLSDAVAISGEGDLKAMDNVVSYEKFEAAFERLKQVEFGSSSSGSFSPDAVMSFDTSLQSLYHKNFTLISESFTRFIQDGYRLLILSDSVYQTDRLKAIFADRGDNIPFTPVSHTIHEGFVDHETKLCFFTDHQIFDRFHKYNLRSDRARGGKLALSLKELQQIEAGDYIVHIDHGIAKFGGLVKTDVNGHPQEMIKLLFQNDDIVLVSIHALHKLSKYRGKEGVPPKISKLGSGAWNRLKEKTKNKMKDIARDLIRLYAARRQEKGFAFTPDSYLQHELEASFIYEDTPDQLKATQDVKADMESARPMDRLICGDVGFGKTEIAVRAAFKAAADNKQTAVLVPTTVLAMQHYHTFSERLKDLPVRVEFISRARKPKEVKQILADLAEGKVDILIGTHKLIGKGVKFKDLGLLIVDEEQKFGVAVKEKLKQLKVNVDTLTMSATPIPRTLQFSLMGARDLSSLNTPPANRQPIETNVSTFDDEVIAEAVNFELSRNGQVFFISNRIENLTTIENTLRRLVPGIRIITAHGQMPPEKLEQAIMDFAAHDYDVLLSTTIVENGIDMPNVNTILINNAHHFGLSELHQLRGRVGRSNKKAFCYLLVPPGASMTPEARRRLQAIENFSDLGSGIHIAMQDLDIRGAGNLLGAEQSGFIADLGYEAYQKILKESVLELKTEEFADEFEELAPGKEEEFVADCTIESDLELRLPPEYVPQESERISLYQQLDNMETPAQTEEFRAQLRDRFGAIPAISEELIKVVPLRMAARRLGIERLALKGGKMRVYFVGDDNKAYYQSSAFGKVLSYLQQDPLRCELRDVNGKRSILISRVTTVAEALSILEKMESSVPV